jgi:hypothetical protein
MVMGSLSKTFQLLNAFFIDLEDDPMPAKYKRQVMKKVGKLLQDLCDISDNESHPRGDAIAYEICKFGEP